MTLTLDFQGQILKMLYLRNGRADWHGTKAVWIDRMLHPLCDFQQSPHPWPWPWIFEVKFWKSHISGMGWLIDMELKGCESIECWTHAVTFNVHLTHDLYLGFSRSKLYLRNGWPIDMERKGCESIGCNTHFVTFNVHFTHDLDLGFSRSNFENAVSQEWGADWHGTKGICVNRVLDPCCDFQCSPLPWPWPWIFKVKFWKSRISGMGWPIHMERKGCEWIGC